MKPLDNQPGRGVLFKETDKQNPKAPDLRGGANIDGREFEIAGWEQVSGRGTPYISLSLKPATVTASAGARPDDDEIDRAFERGMRTR